jgi:hypothetical protein
MSPSGTLPLLDGFGLFSDARGPEQDNSGVIIQEGSSHKRVDVTIAIL